MGFLPQPRDCRSPCLSFSPDTIVTQGACEVALL
jgi:hypothetical protein